MKTRTATSAGGVILTSDGKIVLTSRRSFKGDLHWGLPKGNVEKGELPVDAARREAIEETGLEVEVVSQLPSFDYWYVEPGQGGSPTRVHKFVHWFLMRMTGGDPNRHDHETEEVAMLVPNEALSRASFPSEKKLIAQVIDLASPK